MMSEATENQAFDEFLDEDIDRVIRLNAIHRGIALDAATDLLKTSRHRLNMNLDLPASDVMIACHALLAQREYLRQRVDDGGVAHSIDNLATNFEKINGNLAHLSGIKEQLECVVESIDCAGAKQPQAEKVKLTALSKEHALAALKAGWLKLHKQHTEQEYVDAMVEFEKIVGL
jgi:hypothetical protein